MNETTPLNKALCGIATELPPKPPDDADREAKKRYSEQMSAVLALVFAEELHRRGLDETLPARGDGDTVRGSERRMAGGIGAKKVDITWATEESGLLLAISIKTINFRDGRSGNYQKNLINRRGDMLMEAVTLHRRFPYAVLAGFLFLDAEAANDHTSRRRSTFENAHPRLRLFTGRNDPAGRDEQFERLYLSLISLGDAEHPFRFFEVGSAGSEVPVDVAIDDLLYQVAQRNPDVYEFESGRLVKL